ncbi:MAG TPA: 2-C-methyl-D-erythritol 2,4-cyclodiphosphate synthase [Bacteroidia bacterium]|nr:2-C-methyl-D-erythritol 2,4-cyclodiphosphate synthase [Bacteroidia bacterium]QQR95443.1 MAG: 2-C-methyl-D-erythritol 2,4-cyclodiphosphate synthase [Bacteroidota bacterium]MBP7714974.1 2-C-methyl-D-erythritol 2,4-cyclodiphosphate synthase [Bacteroidia bacterium]MBP8668019.1 2-C-methyl-D-erythritol 2,4-cyclodiphosphate synthase [Bacteroidia bacterium]HQW50358.1 2-C-methyl-D-erythritol 2,4-cyclodiphosphate synthase [Bacteroidia bacterium]
MNFRVGFGFDVHQLEQGIPFFLGGVRIEHYKGAKGHSDADVIIHAICDALLGAAALGDIGKHFPDTSNEFKGIDSSILLAKVVSLLKEKSIAIGNVDVSVVLEKPKIAPYIQAMREKLASVMQIEIDCVSIKATTNEKMGFVGREEGVAAYAVALINRQ